MYRSEGRHPLLQIMDRLTITGQRITAKQTFLFFILFQMHLTSGNTFREIYRSKYFVMNMGHPFSNWRTDTVYTRNNTLYGVEIVSRNLERTNENDRFGMTTLESFLSVNISNFQVYTCM